MATVIRSEQEARDFDPSISGRVRVEVPGDGHGNIVSAAIILRIILQHLETIFNPLGDAYHETNNAVECCLVYGLNARRPGGGTFILNRHDCPKLTAHMVILQDNDSHEAEDIIITMLENLIKEGALPSEESGLTYPNANNTGDFLVAGTPHPAYLQFDFRSVKINGRPPNPTRLNSTNGEDEDDGLPDDEESIPAPLNNRFLNNYVYRHITEYKTIVPNVESDYIEMKIKNLCTYTPVPNLMSPKPFIFMWHHYVPGNKKIKICM